MKFNYAVYNITTGFRMTIYTTRNLANVMLQEIIRNDPSLKGKLAVKQKDFENTEDRQQSP